jgi:contact-dependent growth inhibition (CDI) system CdiI-like immunity protein
VRADEIDHHDPAWDALWTLFGAYLHQSFDLEYKDVWAAVRAYRSEGSPSQVESAIEQVDRLLKGLRTEEELRHAVEELGSYYYPPSEGLTYRDWLTRVEKVLRSG